MKPDRITQKNRTMGTLLDAALKNIEPAEKMLMENSSRIRIDPAKTRLNDLHNRMPASMSGAAIADLVESFRTIGQKEPAEGWRLQRPQGDGVEVVLISGARRRAAALALGVNLVVEIVTEPSPRELIEKMYAENKARRDYHPLELAYEWQRFLNSGAFETVTELATGLGEEPTKVYRVMTLLTLPREVLDAFRDPSTLTLLKGAQLAASVAKSDAAKARAIAAAQDWLARDGQGSPLSTIAAAAAGRAPKPPKSIPRRLLTGGKEVGRVTGADRGDLDLRINLSRDCSPEAREAVLAALDLYYPEWRKTRVR